MLLIIIFQRYTLFKKIKLKLQLTNQNEFSTKIGILGGY